MKLGIIINTNDPETVWNALISEWAYQIPLPAPSACPDCAKCVLACPLKAIELK